MELFIYGGIALAGYVVVGIYYFFFRSKKTTLNLYAISATPPSGADVPSADNISAVVVSFKSIEMQPADGDERVILDGLGTVDFMSLDENMSKLLEGRSVPPGTYVWMRLMVDTSKSEPTCYVETNGVKTPLWIPSGNTTGLKLTKGFTMPENDTSNFAIEFNIVKSLKSPTKAGSFYSMKPTMKLIDNYVPTSVIEVDSTDVTADSSDPKII